MKTISILFAPVTMTLFATSADAWVRRPAVAVPGVGAPGAGATVRGPAGVGR